jgi:hypothetical protein
MKRPDTETVKMLAMTEGELAVLSHECMLQDIQALAFAAIELQVRGPRATPSICAMLFRSY